MVILRAISSSSKSVMVLPSSTRRRRLLAPEVKSNPAVRVVFPESPWPTTPTFRMSLLSYTFTGYAPGLKRNSNTRGWGGVDGRVLRRTGRGNALCSTDGSGPCVVSPATWLGFASIIDFTERTHRLRIKVIGSRACWERQPHRRTHRRTHLGIASFPGPEWHMRSGLG